MSNSHKSKLFRAVALIFIGALCAPPCPAQIRPKSRISVDIPDITDEELNKFYSEIIRKTIQDQIRRSGQYQLVLDVSDKVQTNSIDRVTRGRALNANTKSSTLKDKDQNAEDYIIASDLKLFGQDFVLSMEVIDIVSGDITNTVVEEIKNVDKETQNSLNTTKVIEGTRIAIGKLLGAPGGSSVLLGLKSDIETEFIKFTGNGSWNGLKRQGYSIFVDTSRVNEPRDLPNLTTGRLIVSGTVIIKLLDPRQNEINMYNFPLENKSVVDITFFGQEVLKQINEKKKSDIIKSLLRGVGLK